MRSHASLVKSCTESGRACLNIYRPPSPASSFFSELQDLLVYLASLPYDLVLMGDFNLHLESSSSDVRQLTGILEYFDLNQHVNFPTHIHGHSLDVMIFSNRCDVLFASPSDTISDHFSVVADLKIPTDHSHTVPQTITYRKLKAINMEAFKADINNSDLIKNPKSNATELAQPYDSVLSTLIDFHAPLATKKISPKPPNPWMTPSILASKRHRRYLERVWRRYSTALNRSRFSKQINLCSKQMSKAKSTHYSKIIVEHSGDHRSLWQAFNKILHCCPKMYLPDHSSITTLANTFSSFFINKIYIIQSSFSSGSCSNVLTPPNTREVLHKRPHVTDAEVRRLVLSDPCKSSDLDPLPTGLVKDCINILVTPIVSIVNLSLSEGLFPTHFKFALVFPMLKKPTLNRDDMKNYRPLSNLSFLSKILEKVVASRLNSHINSSHTSNDYQSAYGKFHSTEIALFKIHNDILSSMDNGRVTALIMLDLSAAFDIIDHTILLRRLGNWFGVSGKALDWFKSYLIARSQRIKLGHCLSSRSDLCFGVAQGSVLGPLLFTLYTTSLSSLVSRHAIPHHLYADDSQLYVSFSSGNSAAALYGLQSCLASVQSWMSTNKLKLNPDKTEFLLIGNERQWSKYLSMFPIELELLGVETYPEKSACNLGVIFDKNFNFRSHISAICSSCIYHIRDLRRIRRHLDLDSAKLLANALVSRRLDYCNSLLSGISETDLTKLQRVLNRLTRVVTKSPPFTRSVPLLRSLHWVLVKYRVHFNIYLLTCKALHEEQPVYLRSLIAISLPSRTQRSNRGITLSIPRIKTNTGARAFSSCAPSLWNNLPLFVRSVTLVSPFRRRLKTYLFDLAFPPQTPVCPTAC